MFKSFKNKFLLLPILTGFLNALRFLASMTLVEWLIIIVISYFLAFR